MLPNKQMLPEEEQLGWADLQIELKKALRKDTDIEEAKRSENQQKMNKEVAVSQRKLGDADNKLDEFIEKVNKQADATDELKIILNADKRRCSKVRKKLEKRLSVVQHDNEEMEKLIQEYSSMHISSLNENEIEELERSCAELIKVIANELHFLRTNTQSKFLTLKEVQKSYEQLLALKERNKIREEEDKLRKERLENLRIRLLEETDEIKVVDEELSKLAKDEATVTSEIEAAEEYLEKIKEEIDETQAKTKGLFTHITEVTEELKKVQKQCKEIEDIISALKTKCDSINNEANGLNSLYLHLQWEKKQEELQKGKNRQEVNVKLDGSNDISATCKTVKPENESSAECVARRLRSQSGTKVRECFNETCGTIVFDPVHLVASTPIVSPKRKDSEYHINKSDSKVLESSKTKKCGSGNKAKRCRKKTINRKSKEFKKVAKTTTQKNSCFEKKHMYDMLDSE